MKYQSNKLYVKFGYLREREGDKIIGSNRTVNKFGMPNNDIFAEYVLANFTEVTVKKGCIVFNNWPKSDNGDLD